MEFRCVAKKKRKNPFHYIIIVISEHTHTHIDTSTHQESIIYQCPYIKEKK